MILTLKRLEELCEEARKNGYKDDTLISVWSEERDEWCDLNENDFCI